MGASTIFSKAELSQLQGTEASVSGTPEDRFLQTCVEYFREWLGAHAARLAAGQVASAQAMVMLYAPAPLIETGLDVQLAKNRKQVNRKLCIQENGLIVGNENLRTMVEVVPSFAQAQEALDFCIENLSADHVFVILLMAQRRVLVHQAGSDMLDWIEETQTVVIPEHSPLVITPEMIDQTLTEFYDLGLRTHRGVVSRHMWRVDEKSVQLDTVPEQRVQSALLIQLGATYAKARVLVREEVGNSGGRVDLCVSRFHPVTSKQIETMLELKVLKPAESETASLEWAQKGVTQAAGYRNVFTDACFACIYDARKVKAEMAGLQEFADKEKVILRPYAMELPPLKIPKATKKAEPPSTTSGPAAKSPRRKKAA
jgi:hypothetical protein